MTVGAAIGTVIARFTECGIMIAYTVKKKAKHPYFIGAFSSLYIPGTKLRSFVVKAIPLLCNEALWSLGMSLLTMSYSHYGLAVVAGYMPQRRDYGSIDYA